MSPRGIINRLPRIITLIQYFVAVKAVNTRVGGYQLTGFIPQSWYKFAGAQVINGFAALKEALI
jgi:hypothetical protein